VTLSRSEPDGVAYRNARNGASTRPGGTGTAEGV
jgi:hypothetical protein